MRFFNEEACFIFLFPVKTVREKEKKRLQKKGGGKLLLFSSLSISFPHRRRSEQARHPHGDQGYPHGEQDRGRLLARGAALPAAELLLGEARVFFFLVLFFSGFFFEEKCERFSRFSIKEEEAALLGGQEEGWKNEKDPETHSAAPACPCEEEEWWRA